MVPENHDGIVIFYIISFPCILGILVLNIFTIVLSPISNIYLPGDMTNKSMLQRIITLHTYFQM